MATEISLKTDDKVEKDCVNVTILGRGECGKTSLASRYLNGKHTLGYEATTIDTLTVNWKTKAGKEKTMNIFDTSGQEDYSRLRTITLPYSDYVILAYSIVDRDSFLEVQSTLVDMVKTKCSENVKIIVVGTKLDLYDKSNSEFISSEEGNLTKQDIGAIKFYECSSVTGEGVNEIFEFIKNDFVGESEGNWFSRLFCCM